MATDEKIIGVYGHTNPDLDCATAMWIVEKFLLAKWFPGTRASWQFAPHQNLTKIANDPDYPIIVDGGAIYDPKTLRFDTHGSVTLSKECATSLIAKELDKKDQHDIRLLVESVRQYDTGESAPYPTPLPYVFKILHGTIHDDLRLTQFWHDMLDTWYNQAVLQRQYVIDAIANTLVYGRIAVTPHNAPRAVGHELFEKGYDYVVYQTSQGVGVQANKRVPFGFAQAVLKKLEEKNSSGQFAEWFFHPTGRMACRGSSKAQVDTDSVLLPADLVEIIQGLAGAEVMRLPRSMAS